MVIVIKVKENLLSKSIARLHIIDPDFGIRLLSELKDERTRQEVADRKNQELERKNASMLPKAVFYDTVLEPSNEYMDIGQAAKILKLPYGRNSLFKILREKGIFFKNRNEPKQEYVDRGYFKLFQKPIPRNSHPPKIVLIVLVSQKGLLFLSKLLNIPIEEKLAMNFY